MYIPFYIYAQLNFIECLSNDNMEDLLAHCLNNYMIMWLGLQESIVWALGYILLILSALNVVSH